MRVIPVDPIKPKLERAPDHNRQAVMAKRRSFGTSDPPVEFHHKVLEDEYITNWKAIYIAGVISFLSQVEHMTIGMAEWPYMHTIDEEATLTFFGISTSVSRWGRVLFSLVFSFWTYRSHTVRPQLLLGRSIAMIAAIAYLCVEWLPTGRRYLMLACYFVFAVAGSSSVILRVYLILVSSNQDRSRAFAMTSLAHIMSIIIGPVVQLLFSGISYPGYEILPKIRLHIFSSSIWMAAVINVFSWIFIYYFLDELPKKQHDEEEFTENPTTLGIIKEHIRKIRSLNVPWSLVILCLAERIIMMLSPTTLGTVGSAIYMTTFGWDDELSVKVHAGSMFAVGAFSIVMASLFLFTSFPTRVKPRLCFVIGISIFTIMYISSYPYPFTGKSALIYNETTRTGCNPDEYSWCSTVKSTSPFIFVPIVVTVMGIGMPLAHISADTVYSRISVNADQTLMQALAVVADDILAITTPVYATTIFTLFGQGTLWLCNGAITLSGLIAWLFYYKQLSQY